MRQGRNMITLFQHNQEALDRLEKALRSSNTACVVHPTGTGKAFIAAGFIQNHADSKILYITSYLPNLNDFMAMVTRNVVVRQPLMGTVYSGLNGSEKSYTEIDYCILDEFHRAGAPVWEKHLRQIMERNPGMKLIGFSATPIRYLDGQRNMADELFDGNVVSQITLEEALIQKILPAPHYVTGVYSFEEDLQGYETRIKEKKTKNRAQCIQLLRKAKARVASAGGLKEMFRQKMEKPKGKYIVFCRNKEHMETIIRESRAWFSWVSGEIHQYFLYARATRNEEQLECFRTDTADCLRLLYVIDMLNEGVHIPEIDGVIMIRPTESPNVYLQQLGRALAVDANGHPQIIDIVNNANNLRPLRGFWSGIQKRFESTGENYDFSFEIWGEDADIMEALHELDLAIGYNWHSWETVYEMAEEYYMQYGNLLVPHFYVTEDGYPLGKWILVCRQRRGTNTKGIKQPLTKEQIEKLDSIGMVWDARTETWLKMFAEAETFFRNNGHYHVPHDYLTADGKRLCAWIRSQRDLRKKGSLEPWKIQKLDKVEFVWDDAPAAFEEVFPFLREYVEERGTTSIPDGFCPEGCPVLLGPWKQRQLKKWRNGELTEVQIQMLESIGLDSERERITWEKAMDYVRAFKDKYGHTDIPWKYITQDGYPLGDWAKKIRKYARNHGKRALTDDQRKELESMGFRFEVKQFRTWDESYEYLKGFVDEHHGLPGKNDTYREVCVGKWLYNQVYKTKSDRTKVRLTEEQRKKLISLGVSI